MRAITLNLFELALEAVDPGTCVARHITQAVDQLVVGDRVFSVADLNKFVIIGGGKACAAMTAKVVQLLPDLPIEGAISVPNNLTDLPPLPESIQIYTSSHPIPDASSQASALAILDLVHAAGPQDLVIGLFSGGASALLEAPVAPITLTDLQDMNQVLLCCGASIQEINSIRKHVSNFKGGNVARACVQAPLAALVMSDVIEDPLDVIASGPTVPDESTFIDCVQILEKYAIMDLLPPEVLTHLKAGALGQIPETPKFGDSCFASVTTTLAGSVAEAARAIITYAGDAGWRCNYVTAKFQGEARKRGVQFFNTIELAGLHPGCNIFLHTGELTVTLQGEGIGGRNQEMLLAATPLIPRGVPIVVLSAGMDGIEGNSPAAGAIIDTATGPRMKKLLLSPRDFLAHNDSYHFFAALNDAIIMNLTGTNVNDLTITLVWGEDIEWDNDKGV